jgi:hypothetical protein
MQGSTLALLLHLLVRGDIPAVRDVVASHYSNQLTTQQLEEILRATGYGLPPETLN